MNKRKLNFIVDILMTICFFIVAFIGVLMGSFIGKGHSVSNSSKYFLGFHRHEWGYIHWVFSIAFVIFFIIHLILHWQWVKGAFQKYTHLNALVGSLLVIIISAVIIWIALPIASTGQYAEKHVHGLEIIG
ncbi:MAG: DUF4405 domain-containing protein, partial [bacterium]